VWYAVLLAAALSTGSLVAGCQGGSATSSSSPSASNSPAASPSGSSTPSPSPSPSYSVPPEARTHDEAGAIAFVHFYFDQVNRAWMTPDATLLPQLAESGCQSCAALQRHAADLVAQQRRATAAPVGIRDVRIRPGAPEGQDFLTMTLDQLGVTTVDRDGKVVDSDPVQSIHKNVALIWQGEGWLVYGIS